MQMFQMTSSERSTEFFMAGALVTILATFKRQAQEGLAGVTLDV